MVRLLVLMLFDTVQNDPDERIRKRGIGLPNAVRQTAESFLRFNAVVFPVRFEKTQIDSGHASGLRYEIEGSLYKSILHYSILYRFFQLPERIFFAVAQSVCSI